MLNRLFKFTNIAWLSVAQRHIEGALREMRLWLALVRGLLKRHQIASGNVCGDSIQEANLEQDGRSRNMRQATCAQ